MRLRRSRVRGWSLTGVAWARLKGHARSQGVVPGTVIALIAGVVAYGAFGVSLDAAVLSIVAAVAIYATVMYIVFLTKAPAVLRDHRLAGVEQGITMGQLLAREAQVQLPTDITNPSLETSWLEGCRSLLSRDPDLAEDFERAESAANRGQQVEVLSALARRLREGGARYEPPQSGARLG